MTPAMSRPLSLFLLAAIAFGTWLGYLGWLVGNRRPEPILERLGQDYWPSAAWMAVSEALVEVRMAKDSLVVMRVFKAGGAGPGVGEELPAPLVKVVKDRIAPEEGHSSWIIGLAKTTGEGGKPSWRLVVDPVVPGRLGGLPRVVPATGWTRAWMPRGVALPAG